MSRRVWAWISAFAFLVVISGSFFWTVSTNQGARWAVAVVARLLPLKVEVEDVSGRLAGRLELKGLRLEDREWDMGIDRITFHLQSSDILAGNVVIKELVLQEIFFTDKRPEIKKPIDLAWPKLPRFLSWFSGWVDSFQIKGFTYRSGEEELKLIETLSTKVSWFFGNLSLKNLVVETAFARVEGNVQTTFRRPLLFAALAVAPKKSGAGLDRFLVDINLKPASKQEQMSGLFRVDCLAGKTEKFRVAGKMAVSEHHVRFFDVQADERSRKGRLLGRGGIDFASIEPRLYLHIDLSSLDLSRELKILGAISGSIELESDFSNYHGSFELKNSGSSWKQVSLAGVFKGNPQELTSLALDGKLLSGTVKGTLKAAWNHDVQLSGSLQARDLNPANITPDWQGKMNADVNASFRWPQAKPMEGNVQAELLNSVVRQKAFAGRIEAQWRKGMLDLTRFDLRGKGFDLSARGPLEERIAYQVRISDLSGLIPESKGRLTGEGWVRWRDGRPAGILKGDGSAILLPHIAIGKITMETAIGSRETDILQVKIRVNDLAFYGVKVGSSEVSANGTILNHDVQAVVSWSGGVARASLQGGYGKGLWQGVIANITGRDERFGPFRLLKQSGLKVSASQFAISGLSFSGTSSERLDLAADLTFNPIRGSVKSDWQDLNLARLASVMTTPHILGRTSGSAGAQWLDGDRVKMTASASVEDIIVAKSPGFRIRSGQARLAWNEAGLSASWEAAVGDGGKLQGHFRSEEPAHAGIPETGLYAASWSALDLAMIKSWIPKGLDIKGSVAGQVNGRLLPGSILEATGKIGLSRGVFVWKSPEGVISAEAREAVLDIDWQRGAFKGDISIVLANRGNLKAHFQLPLAAKLPLRFEPQGPVAVSAKGEVFEKGLLTAMFPGLIGESRGQLHFDFTAGGTWQVPDFGGKISLTDAGAYLNPAGIKIENVSAQAELKGDRININSFRARSGSGVVQGSATVLLGDGRVVRYEGKLWGERFQAVYLPEVQVQANPDLSFEGTMEKFALRGSILIPEALVRYEGKEGVISSSTDVVIVDAPEKQKKPPRMAIDMRVSVVLGEKVRIEALGVDTRLEGKVLVAARNLERITADGRIETVKGQFKRRGITLDITRGNLVFAGGAVDLAALDIRATRKIRDPYRFNDIQAGVSVTGTLRSPLVKLYSEPAMADADVLSYIVLGKPLAAGMESGQTALLLQAAGMIFAKDQSESLAGRVKKLVGIDTFDIQTGSQPTIGQQVSTPQIGGQQISGSPSGITQSAAGQSASANGSGGVAGSIVTVGKYLSPELYVAFGRSLLSNDYRVTTRYSFQKRWELEGSRQGVETGVDLFYKIEFE